MRPVYQDDKVLDMADVVKSVDGYDNVAVFFHESGKCVPYEHEFKKPVPGSIKLPPVSHNLSCETNVF